MLDNLSDDKRSPEDWEIGCSKDYVRNKIVIPDIVDRVNANHSTRCADVGAGTGYITREIIKKYPELGVQWSLLEIDQEMREYCAAKAAGLKGCSVISYDVFEGSKCLSKKFDIVFCCFSCLEFGISLETVGNMTDLACENGKVVLYLPDVLEDVEKMCVETSTTKPISSYRRGVVDVSKVDKFTKKREKFLAVRVEIIISYFITSGFFCSDLKFIRRDEERSVVVLEFCRDHAANR